MGIANDDDKGTTGGEKQVRFQEVKSRETDTKTGKRRYLFDKRGKKEKGFGSALRLGLKRVKKGQLGQGILKRTDYRLSDWEV